MKFDGNFWLTLLLSAGGAGGIIATIYTVFKDIRDRRALRRKDAAETGLTEEQRKEVQAEAALVGTEERIKIETWWKEQFDAVKAENVEIRKENVVIRTELNNERRERRLITRALAAHQPWDELVQVRLREAAIHVPPPPTLDPMEYDD